MSQFQMTFRGLLPSEPLRRVAEEKFERLVRRLGTRAACQVVVSTPTRPSAHGGRFTVRVLLRAGAAHVSAEAQDESATAALRSALERAACQIEARRRPRTADMAGAMWQH